MTLQALPARLSMLLQPDDHYVSRKQIHVTYTKLWVFVPTQDSNISALLS